MGKHAVSSFWILRIKLLWSSLYKSFYGYLFSFFLGKYQSEVVLLYVRFIFGLYKKLSDLFPKRPFHCTFREQSVRVLVASHSLSNFLLSVSLNFSHASGCEKLPHGISLCTFLITNDVDQFVMYLQAICVFSLGSICLILLSILPFALFLLTVVL